MEMELGKVSRVLDEAADLFDELRTIITSHASYYFVDDYPNSAIPGAINEALKCLSLDQIQTLPSLDVETVENQSSIAPLVSILKRSRTLIRGSEVIRSKQRLFRELGLEEPNVNYSGLRCAEKKRHEVVEACDVISSLCGFLGLTSVTDLGSGKGHLGSVLAGCCGIDVVCVENRAFLAENSAKLHARRVATFGKKSSTNRPGEFIVESDLVTSSSDLERLNPKKQPFAVIGLHACGNLAVDAAELYANTSSSRAMFMVGCCYNFLVEEFDDSDPYTVEQRNEGLFRFPVSETLRKRQFGLTRNARMLGLYASQRINTVSASRNGLNTMEGNESCFFRAVLELMISETGGKRRIGDRIGDAFRKCGGDFVEYSSMCWQKLGLDQTLWCGEKAKDVYERCLQFRKDFFAFQQLRTTLAPLVEFIILVDRLMALLEKGLKNSWLVQIFDPVQSPRCFAIVSYKE